MMFWCKSATCMDFLSHGILLKEGIQEPVFASQKRPRFLYRVVGHWIAAGARLIPRCLLRGERGVWHFQWQKLGFGRLGSPQLWDHTISLYVFGRLTNPGYRPLINWHDPPRTPIQVSLISTILECEFKILVHASKCWFQTCSTCNTLQETNSQPPSSARVFESMLMWDMLLSGDI